MLLISALVIFPALSAMRIFHTFLRVTVCSVILSVICAFSWDSCFDPCGNTGGIYHSCGGYARVWDQLSGWENSGEVMSMKRKRKNTTIQYRHGCEQNPMWSFRWDFRFPVLLLVSSILLLTGCAGETKSAGSANTGNYNKENSVSGVLESRTAESVSGVGQDNGKVKGTEDKESLENGNSLKTHKVGKQRLLPTISAPSITTLRR